ncbi:MAG: lysophospholipid acyltransferase family protein [Candidatus Margulisiibacteriota bacterium]
MQKIINSLHSIFFYLFVAVTFLVGMLITMAAALFSKDKERTFQNAARIWAKLLARISRIKVKVEGMENLPHNQPVVLAANHQSAADILILLAYIPTYFKFVAKRELFKVPLFGSYLRLAGYIPIDRQSNLKAHKTLYDISKLIRAGDSILIFPEGTRTRTGELGPFKRGSLVIAQQAGVPVVPIAISGSFNIMPKGTRVINPTKVKLSIGEPIPVEHHSMEEILNRVRSKITSMLKEDF